MSHVFVLGTIAKTNSGNRMKIFSFCAGPFQNIHHNSNLRISAMPLATHLPQSVFASALCIITRYCNITTYIYGILILLYRAFFFLEKEASKEIKEKYLGFFETIFLCTIDLPQL